MLEVLSGQIRELRRRSIVGQLVVLLLGLQLLFVASFVALNLPTATWRNLAAFSVQAAQKFKAGLPPKYACYLESVIPEAELPERSIRYSAYVPEAPLSIFMGYALGPLLGFLACFSFALLGLFGPMVGLQPLAAGGGLDYLSQPGFGYLIGMPLASYVAGQITSSRTSLRQLAAVFAGLLLLHLCGLAYLFGNSLLVAFAIVGHGPDWQRWVFEEARNLTWYQLPYDIIFSVGLIGIGFPLRWLIGTLTAPDIALKQKNPRLQYFDADLERRR